MGLTYCRQGRAAREVVFVDFLNEAQCVVRCVVDVDALFDGERNFPCINEKNRQFTAEQRQEIQEFVQNERKADWIRTFA